ncbi:MAG: hypothetical protein SFY68_12745 [Candidatus Sumerlaeia bacterium]|nr:hypothetical protein [Candidatus Sumerlaeia bacterium]
MPTPRRAQILLLIAPLALVIIVGIWSWGYHSETGKTNDNPGKVIVVEAIAQPLNRPAASVPESSYAETSPSAAIDPSLVLPEDPMDYDLEDPFFTLIATGQLELATLLKKHSPAEVYAMVGEEMRLDLVAWLADTGQMETQMLALLDIEEDSSLRAWLFDNYLPDHQFEDFEGEEFPVDTTLREALGKPTRSAIGPEEYMARIRAASGEEEALTASEVRNALKDFPDHPLLQFNALQSLARAAQSNPAVATPEELRRAHDHLTEALSVPSHESKIPLTDRIQGYLALQNWKDAEARRDFFRDQLRLETEPMGRDILTQLYESALQELTQKP